MYIILIILTLILVFIFIPSLVYLVSQYSALYREYMDTKRDFEEKLQTLQKDLAQKEETFDLVVNNIPIGLILKDVGNDFRYLLWNKMLETETGISRKKILGKTNFEQEPVPKLGQFFHLLDQECARRGTSQSEYEATTPEGEEKFYITEKRLLKLQDGRELILSAVQDLTSIWILKKRLADTVERQDRFITKTHIIYDCIDFMASHHELNDSYKYILKSFGSAENALRSYLYYFKETNKPYAEYTYEWTSNGENQIPDFLRKIDLEQVPVATKTLLVNKKSLLIDYSEVNPNSIFMEWIARENIGYVIFVPLFYEDKTFGLIGFDYKERQKVFSDISLLVINSAARLIELIYARQQMSLKKIEMQGAV